MNTEREENANEHETLCSGRRQLSTIQSQEFTDIYNMELEFRVGLLQNGHERLDHGCGLRYVLSKMDGNVPFMDAPPFINWLKMDADFHLMYAAYIIDLLEMDADDYLMDAASIFAKNSDFQN